MNVDIEFCPECSNILTAKDCHEKNQLMYYCCNCSFFDYPDPFDQRKNTVATTTFNFRSKEDVHSYIVPGMASDATLPRNDNWICLQCQNRGAVYFQLPERISDDAMTLVLVCVACQFYEIRGKETNEPEKEEVDEIDDDLDEFQYEDFNPTLFEDERVSEVNIVIEKELFG